MKTFYLVDGHAQIFRAYYAPFGQLSSPSGEPTKAVYIFTQMILSIIRDKKPDFLAVALDVGDSSTERKKFYPEYKANRDETPEDIGPQTLRIKEILQTMKIPIYEIKGFEADDIIATAAELLKDQPVDLRIVSSDKDLHQVLSDKVRLWNPQKDTILDGTNLEEEKGYTPEQAVEIQTLTGDSTDNIPGIPGIGPKKAAVLIKKYGTADKVFENAEELTPKMRENVLASEELLKISRELVTLKRDVSFGFDLDSCAVKEPEASSLLPLFRELGFRRLVDTFEELQDEADRADEPPAPAAARGTHHKVDTPEKLESLKQNLMTQKIVAVDTETTSLRPRDCTLVGLSFSWKPEEGWYVPLRSNTLFGTATLPAESTLESLREFLESPDVQKCGQNIKYDIVALRSAGIELRGVTFDTMVASYLLRPDRRQHGMDTLAKDLLNYNTIPISDLIGKGKKQISMLDADLDQLTEYAAEDADVTLRLHDKLSEDLSDPDLRKLFDDVEMPLVHILADMEFEGVALDKKVLSDIAKRLEARIESLRDEIYKSAEREFTIDSPKQLAEILFDELGFRVVKKTKTSRSTDASVLETLAVETAHPLPQLILEYRELTKLLNTYLLPLPEMISSRTGRLHASFNQTVAATGRLSSSDPNLQNIPIRTEQGREIRKAFIARSSDHALITADYSQIELRILAHLSRDPGLIQAFTEDLDVHRFVASQIYDLPPEEVTSELRTKAKAVNFGIIYGQGAFGLARSLGIGRSEASEFIRLYKERYSGIVDFMDECVATAVEKGFVATMLGRRRPMGEIQSRNRMIRAQGERLAINTVVQGSAADMIKVAMVRIHDRIQREKLDLKLLIQVHDELVYEAPKSQAQEFAELVSSEMSHAIELDVPLKVDVALGDNWLEGKG